MATKNKANSAKRQRDTHMTPPNPGRRIKNQTNNSDNTGEINRGNTINIGSSRNSGELHTKKSVTGSDSDGQAE